MRLVILESPYAAKTQEGINVNVAYARRCLRDCLARNEAAIASHLLYTQPDVLRDEISEERLRGILAGLAWIEKADAMVVYNDLGISPGMKNAIAVAIAHDVPVEYRKLPTDALVGEQTL